MKDKNIIQTQANYESMTPFELVSYERWRLLNPDYTHRFFTNEESDQFVEKLFPDQFDHYMNLTVGTQNDIKRLCIVYDLGGVYVDTDTYPVIPLRDYMPNKSFVPFVHHANGMLCGHMFAAEKGDQLIYRMAASALELTQSQPEPDRNNYEAWAGWFFDNASVHLYEREMRAAGVQNSGCVSGCTYHSHDLTDPIPDNVRAVHYGLASWMPPHKHRSKAEVVREQSIILARIKHYFPN